MTVEHVTRGRRGRAVEFEEFASQQIPRLSHVARGLAASRQDAEDLVSETLLRVYKKWHRVARMDAPAAYARTVLTRLAIDGRRSEHRRPIAVVSSLVLTEMGGLDADFTERIDRQLDVDALISQLRPRERAVVVLRSLGYDYAAIADTLRVAVGTARSLAHRAMRQLHDAAENLEGTRHG